MGVVLSRRRASCFVFAQIITLFAAVFPCFADYECPNPSDQDKQDARCKYIDEALGIFDGFDKNEEVVKARPPTPKIDTIQDIIDAYGSAANDCLNGFRNQTDPRLLACAKNETQKTGCVKPSRDLYRLYNIYMKRVARCRSLRPNKVQACLDRVQKDLFKQFRKAADALIAAANARARALEKEKKKNCNNNNQCQAPLVSASTQELADNCASFGKHGFVNGIFGASPMCTMPMQFCPMPTPTLTAAPKPDPDPPFEEEPDPAS